MTSGPGVGRSGFGVDALVTGDAAAWAAVPERGDEVVIRSGHPSWPLCCAICGVSVVALHGLYLAMAGSGEVVCGGCCKDVAPVLASVLELVTKTCRIAVDSDRPPMLIPHLDLLSLALASAQFQLALPRGQVV